MDADWANLGEPLCLILDKLVKPIHHVWFSAVCKNWYSIAMLNHQNNQLMSNRTVLPMLMIPTTRNNIEKRSLYDISSNEVYNINLHLPYNKRCCGSSHGWVATANHYGVITLFNPFNNVVSNPLPPIKYRMLGGNSIFCHVHKVILSANPATRPHDYVVLAIYSAIYSFRNALAFMKAGEGFWNYIDYDLFDFTDVTFYKGVVYVVGRRGNIVSFDVSYSHNRANFLKLNIVYDGGFGGSVVFRRTYANKVYLVKSLEGDLWLVRRFIDADDDYIICTRRFHVYKLEIDEESGKLLQMLKLDNLGDNILFVGNGDSFSLSASYFSNCLQRDSIYHTNESIDGPFHSGIYNVKDGSFRKYYLYKQSFKHMPPPVWVEPQFHSG